MSQKLNLCMHPVKKCLLQEGERSLQFDLKSRDAFNSGDAFSSEKTISFEINSNLKETAIIDNEVAIPTCTCCKPMDFRSQESLKLYEQAAKKGRRGVVLSLEIDQTTSYVTTLSSEEHLKFRFQMPNSKQVR